MDLKTIGEILSDRLVVPEIQRDYVWGVNNTNPDIVKNFVTDLNGKAKNDEAFQLGFLYSYTHGGELHLIDGQQRMTTLVLLAFFCACEEGVESEWVMEKISHFSYRVRVDTEKFLHSLFSHKDNFRKDPSLFSSEKLKDNTWFRATYNQDTTILSMVNCLDVIYAFFSSAPAGFYITSAWIMNKLSFWTFEVAQTSQGEELYISMNSRGEALTDSELFKPRLFEKSGEFKCRTASSWGKAWDNWEELLFKRRIQKESNMPTWNYPVEKVGDALNTFLRILIELETGKPHNKIEPAQDASKLSLPVIESYFTCLDKVVSNEMYRPEIQDLYESKDSFVLKVLLVVVKKDEPDDEIARIYPIVKNLERRNLFKNEGLLKFLCEYQHQKDMGWLDFILSRIDETNEPAKREIAGVLNNHEWLKIKRYQETKSSSLEAAYHEAERHNVLNGYIRAVWDEAFVPSSKWDKDSLDMLLNTFKKRYEAFTALFDDKYIKKKLVEAPSPGRVDNSLIARAMMAIKSYGVWVSGRNYAYGWKGDKKNYWSILASRRAASSVISKIIDRLVANSDLSEETIALTLNSIIRESAQKYGRDSGLYYIVNYPESLKAQSEGHNIISFDGNWDNFNIWILEKDNAHSYYFNMFLSILFYRNKGKEGIGKLEPTRILLRNKLYIKCSWRQGWDVVFKDWGGNCENLKHALDKIAEANHTMCLDNEDTRKLNCYFIQRGENDQIELGQTILDWIRIL